ncbi:hypothetical protein HJC99_00980 [Candidatus Saccharibacteria bacterium]|nr:hypothetical protein [Candidatus Saccharibacteria bacterium]
MLFFGLFILIVLPIFLWFCISLLKKNPDLNGNPATKFIIAIFYLFGGMAVLTDLIIIAHLLKLI